MNSSLNGFYRGIIVQNNDPQKLGRVRVFVPHIHMSLLDIEEKDYNSEFYFGEFGTNYQSDDKNLIDLTKYIEKIKLKLPWAEVSLPITGGGFSSFNSSGSTATVSDSSIYQNHKAEKNGETGSPIGSHFKENPPVDAWTSETDNPNSLGTAYTSQAYYNSPKGMFGVPQVNAKVWLFFLEGNPNTPVVFGYSPSSSSYKEIYDDTNYPNGYENNDIQSTENPENQKRRQLTALNYKGGSISFNGTDNDESVSICHDSGSQTEYNNSGKKSLVIGQNNKLIKGSQYVSIEDSASFYCADDSEIKILGDIKIQAGTANYKAAQQWKEKATKIHNVKSLPETQNSKNDSFFCSPLAEKSGTNPACPACSSGRKLKTLLGGNGDEKNKSKIDSGQTSFLDSLVKSFLSFLGGAGKLEIGEAEEESYPKSSDCKVCGGSGKSPAVMGGDFPKETRKDDIGKMYVDSAKDFYEAENSLGNGGNIMLNVTKDFYLSIGCASNDLDSIRINKEGAAHDYGIKLDSEKGLYPSQVTTSTVERVHVDKFPGGQFTVDANNGVNIKAGSGGINFDTTGVMSLYGTVNEITGEQVNISSNSGMYLATSEVLSLKAPTVAIESDNQTYIKNNLAVDGNVVCRGGAIIQGELFAQHITAPLCFQETEIQPELYGRAYAEKPLIMGFIKNTQEILAKITCNLASPGTGWFVIDSNGVTCPVQGSTTMTSNDVTLTLTQFVPIYTTDSGQEAEEGSIYVYPHKHVFRNLPLTLGGTYEEVRGEAGGIDGNGIIEAKKVENGLTAPKIKGVTREKGVGLQNQLSADEFTPIDL
jgi:hypothetical protein